MENMTQAPHVIRGARTGLRLGEGKLEDSLMVALLDTHCGLYMAQTSDNLARQHGVSREDMDAYALRSQKAAAAARARGVFKDEIVPVDAPQGRKTVRVEEDDHLRPDTTLEGLAALKPSFGKDGFVTAGNASGIVDGAAALLFVVHLAAVVRARSGVCCRAATCIDSMREAGVRRCSGS
jgi:acetyl-CoA acetyltransferase